MHNLVDPTFLRDCTDITIQLHRTDQPFAFNLISRRRSDDRQGTADSVLKKRFPQTARRLNGERAFFACCYVNTISDAIAKDKDAYFSDAQSMTDFFDTIGQKRAFISRMVPVACWIENAHLKNNTLGGRNQKVDYQIIFAKQNVPF